MTWRTNRKISASSPKDYLLSAINKTIEEKEIESRLKTHLIPVEEFFAEDYEKFLYKRAEMVFEGMKELINGHNWRP